MANTNPRDPNRHSNGTYSQDELREKAAMRQVAANNNAQRQQEFALWQMIVFVIILGIFLVRAFFRVFG